MKSQFNIPNKINVGFQKRKGTYTGKLAFVVYTDNKGVLRKEKSWDGWRNQNIDPEEFENIPTDGFVLNKKVGDGGGGWNPRQAWVRIYDPRGFEFEIGVDNLIFILEECSSIKGKGLEGEFVYAWSGAQLILLPVSSQEYKDSNTFKKACEEKIKRVDFKEGFCFLNKRNEEVMYLGRLDYWSWVRKADTLTYRSQKKHVFVPLNNKENRYMIETGFTKIVAKIGDDALPGFAGLFEKYKKTDFASAPVKITASKTEATSYHYGHSTFIKNEGEYHTVRKYYKNNYSFLSGYERKFELRMSKKPTVIFEDGKFVKIIDDFIGYVLPKSREDSVVSLTIINEHKRKIRIG